jgi:catechol-2,3-dioxygenase
MIIQTLSLYTRNLETQRAFLTEHLGILPLEVTAQQLAFQIGHTKLIFEQNPDWNGFCHYAFQIPEHQFEEAVQWLKQRCPLLANSEGQQEFFFDIWNAHAVYFADADGNIAELIARHEQKSLRTTPFAADAILGVNEIGLVVPDVPAAVHELEQAYSLSPYLGLSHPEFTAVGGIEGLFIVVKSGRPWLPTGQPATLGWFSGAIQTPTGQHIFTTNAQV